MSKKKLHGAARLTHLLAEMGGGAKWKGGGGMAQGIKNFEELTVINTRKECKAEFEAEGFAKGYVIGRAEMLMERNK